MSARSDRILKLQAELQRERAAAKAEAAATKESREAAEAAARNACWEWHLIAGNDRAKTSVEMARRDVAMARAWLSGTKAAELGRLHGISGERVRQACLRVVRRVMRASAIPYGTAVSDADLLAALQKLEAQFNVGIDRPALAGPVE